MDKTQLEQLGDLKVPRASEAAKARALAKATQTFEAVQSEAKTSVQENSLSSSQGKSVTARLKRYVNQIGSFKMTNYWKPMSGVATICLIVTGAVLWTNFEGAHISETFTDPVREVKPSGDVAVKTKTDNLPSSASAKAPAMDAFVIAKTPTPAQTPSADAAGVRLKSAARGETTQPRSQGLRPVLRQRAKTLGKVRHYAQPAPGIMPRRPYPHDYYVPPKEQSGEIFHAKEPFSFVDVTSKPQSTFSIDVDTASYAMARRSINAGRLPRAESVRVEEFVNYFTYQYDAPKLEDANADPFSVATTVYPSPWNSHTKLLHIALQGAKADMSERPDANLVFLVDVSGSMRSQDKLPLLKQSLSLALSKLKPTDTVAIVTYAGHAGVALKATPVSERAKITQVLDQLQSGGSTAGSQGIKTAYDLAEQNFKKDGINRIFLATDGDFNVGLQSRDGLKKLVEEKRKTGVFLSVLGFGRGNINDSFMQVLAQNGNGVAAYIDSYKEAYKVLVEEAASNLVPIAKDVKIQIEFNPSQVAQYRLIGYETRALKREDFNNDKVDAGELNSGHSVTAIYEIVPVGSSWRSHDELRYSAKKKTPIATQAKSSELAFVKLRYKPIGSDTSKLISQAVDSQKTLSSFEQASPDVKFATSVAGFAQLLRGNNKLNSYSYTDVLKGAREGLGLDKYGYRSEFLKLVDMAKSLKR